MPAILTHDFFGRDVYDALFERIGGSRAEADAFLLGNQGPDPLFFSVLNPRMAEFCRVGSLMHAEKPAELVFAFRQALVMLDSEELPVGRAYALGFLCHYTLDSRMHPFVYWWERALCDAGVEGLSRRDGNEVHAVIESTLDEMVLFAKTGETVATYVPHKRVLRASNDVLRVVSKLYSYVVVAAYSQVVPDTLFASSVRAFRLAQMAFDSPSGVKRALVGRLEELVRPHSFFRSMSHRAVESTECEFDNREHALWTDPFTDKPRTDGFWDIYDAARKEACDRIDRFLAPRFDLAAAREMTAGLNFSGEPTAAVLIAVNDAPKRAGKEG